MDAEPEPCRVQHPSDREFGARVRAFDRAHVAGAGFGSETICHAAACSRFGAAARVWTLRDARLSIQAMKRLPFARMARSMFHLCSTCKKNPTESGLDHTRRVRARCRTADDPRAKAIAAAAARLNELREAWLNPPDLVTRVPEVMPGFPDRLLPVDEKAAILKKRTLTNLYNERPAGPGYALTRIPGRPRPPRPRRRGGCRLRLARRPRRRADPGTAVQAQPAARRRPMTSSRHRSRAKRASGTRPGSRSPVKRGGEVHGSRPSPR